jgi:ribose 5-phosphate isomerase B
MNIAIANDHAGTDLKNAIIEALSSEHDFTNFGTDNLDSVDYPDHAHPLAERVRSGESELGILICGSGNGVCMTANKYQDIRAGLCWTPEIAALARQHNNANVVCIPARFVSQEEGIAIAKAFLNTAFEGGRHERRVNKIACS